MRISNIKNIKKTMEENHLTFKKKYGQNFLIDQNVLDNICKYANIDKETGIIEIGPGLGSLTEFLAIYAKKVLCYEIDQDLIKVLEKNFENENVTIIHQDILKADLEKDIKTHLSSCSKIYVVSNLPYYITSAILKFLLENNSPIDKFVLMMQKEVADKLNSSVSLKDNNALSCLIEYKTNIKKLFNLPSTVFYPKPNVDSSVISLEKRIEKKYDIDSEIFFYSFLNQCFIQKRKTLMNNLFESYPITKENMTVIFDELEINPTIRCEALSLGKLVELCNKIYFKINE